PRPQSSRTIVRLVDRSEDFEHVGCLARLKQSLQFIKGNWHARIAQIGADFPAFIIGASEYENIAGEHAPPFLAVLDDHRIGLPAYQPSNSRGDIAADSLARMAGRSLTVGYIAHQRDRNDFGATRIDGLALAHATLRWMFAAYFAGE